MYREMDYNGLMRFGIDTVYGMHNPKTQEVIIVSDLRRFDHSEYRVEKGDCFGVKAVWEGVNNFVSLDFFPGRFLPTLISQKPSIYKGLWALPTPGLWNKMEGQRHKIKNTILYGLTNQNRNA